jgi:hypothetical protein
MSVHVGLHAIRENVQDKCVRQTVGAVDARAWKLPPAAVSQGPR